MSGSHLTPTRIYVTSNHCLNPNSKQLTPLSARLSQTYRLQTHNRHRHQMQNDNQMPNAEKSHMQRRICLERPYATPYEARRLKAPLIQKSIRSLFRLLSWSPSNRRLGECVSCLHAVDLDQKHDRASIVPVDVCA